MLLRLAIRRRRQCLPVFSRPRIPRCAPCLSTQAAQSIPETKWAGLRSWPPLLWGTLARYASCSVVERIWIFAITVVLLPMISQGVPLSILSSRMWRAVLSANYRPSRSSPITVQRAPGRPTSRTRAAASSRSASSANMVEQNRPRRSHSTTCQPKFRPHRASPNANPSHVRYRPRHWMSSRSFSRIIRPSGRKIRGLRFAHARRKSTCPRRFSGSSFHSGAPTATTIRQTS